MRSLYEQGSFSDNGGVRLHDGYDSTNSVECHYRRLDAAVERLSSYNPQRLQLYLSLKPTGLASVIHRVFNKKSGQRAANFEAIEKLLNDPVYLAKHPNHPNL